MAPALRPLILQRTAGLGVLMMLAGCQWLPFATTPSSQQISIAPEARQSVLPAHSGYERIAKALGETYPSSSDPAQTLQAALDANARIHQGLSLYLQAQAARERAQISQNALAKLPQGASFDTLTLQARAQLQADLAQDHDVAQTASAKLNAMAGSQIAGDAGMTELPDPLPAYTPLASLLDPAQAQAHRAHLQRLQRDLILLRRQEGAQAAVAAQMSAHLQKKAQEALATDHQSLANVERNLVTTRFAANQILLDIAKELGLLGKGE